MKYSTRPNDKKYHTWRKLVLERDKYICQHCYIEGKKIHAHHIIEWDKDESLRYEVSNGLTLCTSCHNKHHFLGKPGWRKGIPCDEKTAERLRSYNIGRVGWNKGKKTSPEAKAKMRAAKLGKKATPETREKMSLAAKGKIFSKETCLKISIAKKGKTFTAEHCMKLSKAKRSKPSWNKGISGEKHHLYGKKRIIDPETGKHKYI